MAKRVPTSAKGQSEPEATVLNVLNAEAPLAPSRPPNAQNGQGTSTVDVQDTADKRRGVVPHVHVFGDLAELHLRLVQESLPDHRDSTMAPYRKLRGFVERSLPGGAWSVAQCIRAVLGDIWKVDSSVRTEFAQLQFEADQKDAWKIIAWGDRELDGAIHSVSATLPKVRVDSNDEATLASPIWPAPNEERTKWSGILEPKQEKNREALHEFKSGVLTLQLDPAKPNQIRIGAELQSRNYWVPSFNLWPTKSQIRYAIRFVDPDVLGRQFQTLGVATELWERLQKEQDASEPLKKFLELSSDGFSRMVLLLPDKAEKLPTDSGFAGYLLFRIDRNEWLAWSSLCSADIMSQSDEELRSNFTLFSSRCFFDFPQETARPAVPAASTDELLDPKFLFAIPIPTSLLTLLQPSQRPSDDLTSPLAVVTTTVDEFVSPVIPVWKVENFNSKVSDGSKQFRLNSAQGYDWPENRIKRISHLMKWIQQIAETTPKSTPNSSKSIEMALSHYHEHNTGHPEWAPAKVIGDSEFKNLVIMDLNFGFRLVEHHPSLFSLMDGASPLEKRWNQLKSKYGKITSQFNDVEGSLASPQTLPDLLQGLSDLLSEVHEVVKTFALIEPTEKNIGFPDKFERQKLEGTLADLQMEQAFQPSELRLVLKQARNILDRLKFVEDGRPAVQILWHMYQSERLQYSTKRMASLFMAGELKPPSQSESPLCPDWWHPLCRWLSSYPNIGKGLARPDMTPESHWAARGWLVAIMGRQLPLRPDINCEGCDEWDRNDLWDLLRHAEVSLPDGKNTRTAPLFRDRVVLILSGGLLRASGARISRRLSWEKTAIDCLRELENHARFTPLMEFAHLIIRFGCSAAIYIYHEESPNGKIIRKSLLYDATAKDGFHRDTRKDGRVIGSNSVFAARVLRELILNDQVDSEDAMLRTKPSVFECIKRAIRQSIIDCQQLHDRGYGDSFEEVDDFQIEYTAPDEVLFEK